MPESANDQRTPHSSSKLSQTTDEAGHTDDSVGCGNATSTDVEHGENKGCSSEGEETTGDSIRPRTASSRRGKYSQRSRVADDPQLRGGVVNVGVGRERASGGSSTTVVVVITDVVGVADGGLLGGSGHGGSSRMKKSEKGDWTWGREKEEGRG